MKLNQKKKRKIDRRGSNLQNRNGETSLRSHISWHIPTYLTFWQTAKCECSYRMTIYILTVICGVFIVNKCLLMLLKMHAHLSPKREQTPVTTMPYKMSHVMRKPVFAICEQQRRRSAAHPCSLISVFIVCCLDSLIPLVSISKMPSVCLVSVAEQAGVSLTWSETPKTDFLVTRLKSTIRTTVSERTEEKQV